MISAKSPLYNECKYYIFALESIRLGLISFILFSSLLAFWCGSFLFKNRCLLGIIFWRNILHFPIGASFPFLLGATSAFLLIPFAPAILKAFTAEQASSGFMKKAMYELQTYENYVDVFSRKSSYSRAAKNSDTRPHSYSRG